MNESQNIEFKQSWRDEYLKWICGFANANGGTIYIGIDDDGRICGIDDSKKLMEDIPNKVRDIMGIFVDVNLHEEDEKQYLEIVTKPYPYPVSYKGIYHYRSGSTKQELKGAALDRFLLKKQGKTWDGLSVPNLNIEDLDNSAFAAFRKKAMRSGRMEEYDLMEDNSDLLDKLRLIEDGMLKKAVALLFYDDPEKFVTGAFVKIGFFREGSDLIYQDEVHGNLFHQVKTVMDLLTTKYMRARISYEGIQRVETLPVPKEALREALLNSIVHKTYESNIPIQIAVFDDKLEIWNTGVLPDGWTIDNIVGRHRSHPYNPNIANAFFRAGEIETWGRGIERMMVACRDAGIPKPEFYYDGGLWTVFKFSESTDSAQETKKTTQETKSTTQEIENSTQEIKTTTPQTESATQETGKTVSQQQHGKTKRMTELQQLILNYLKEHPNATRKELNHAIPHASDGGIKYNLKKMQIVGLLKRVGSTKKGVWIVIE